MSSILPLILIIVMLSMMESCNSTKAVCRDEVVVATGVASTVSTSVATTSSVDSSFLNQYLRIDSIILQFQDYRETSAVGDNQCCTDSCATDSAFHATHEKHASSSKGTRRARDLLQGAATIKIYGINQSAESQNTHGEYNSLCDSVTQTSHIDVTSSSNEKTESSTKALSFFHVLGILVFFAAVVYVCIKARGMI